MSDPSAKPLIQDRENVPRALVVGSGLLAAVAAQTFAEMGAHATFARLQDALSHPLAAEPSSSVEEEPTSLNTDLSRVTVMDVDRPPVVQRDGGAFVAVFSDATTSRYDCLLLAPEISLAPKPAALPQDVELLTPATEIRPGQRIVFLMDYLRPSDPSLGMAAIRLGTQNKVSGGESVVCFQHVPVAHLFGEALYDEARRLGVRFVRFGDEPPTVRTTYVADKAPAFRLSVKDVIDSEEFAYDCDRVLVVTGPDAGSVPKWAVEMAGGDVDSRGFLLSDSVHAVAGSAFASGIFVTGTGTGNLDLIKGTAEAKTAAATARAWMRTSRMKVGTEPVSISSRCVRCLTCYRVCPHRAISMSSGSSYGRMQVWPSLCRECGICVTVCPSIAIRLETYPEESLTSWVRCGDPTAQMASSRDDMTGRHREEQGLKGTTIAPCNSGIEQTTFVFGCRRSAGRIAESIALPQHVRFVAVPCAGSVSEHVLWSALAAGARGILVVGCHQGNCRSRTGTDWAGARVAQALGTGLFGNQTPRIGFITVAPNEPARFLRLVEEFVSGKQ
jgi:quinone-modifying oxidoreductase, subunit QmoB